jgi:hypothetical protein
VRLARFVQAFLLGDIHTHSCHFFSASLSVSICADASACDWRFTIFLTASPASGMALSLELRFRLQPIPRLVASFAPRRVEFVGTAASLFLKVNGVFFAISVCGSQLLDQSRASP